MHLLNHLIEEKSLVDKMLSTRDISQIAQELDCTQDEVKAVLEINRVNQPLSLDKEFTSSIQTGRHCKFQLNDFLCQEDPSFSQIENQLQLKNA